MPHASDIHPALVTALHTLIVPGLKQLGFAVDGLEAWLAAGCFTDRPPSEFTAKTLASTR